MVYSRIFFLLKMALLKVLLCYPSKFLVRLKINENLYVFNDLADFSLFFFLHRLNAFGSLADWYSGCRGEHYLAFVSWSSSETTQICVHVMWFRTSRAKCSRNLFLGMCNTLSFLLGLDEMSITVMEILIQCATRFWFIVLFWLCIFHILSMKWGFLFIFL